MNAQSTDFMAEIMSTQPRHRNIKKTQTKQEASISPTIESLHQSAEAFQSTMSVLLSGMPTQMPIAKATLHQRPSVVPRQTVSGGRRFDSYAWDWFEKFKVPKLRPRTAANYRLDIRKHIVPFFGQMSLDEITTMDVQAFYNEKAHLAHSTIRCMGIILHGIFESAIEDGLIQNDPTHSKRLTMSDRKGERKALTLEEVRDIINNLHKLKDQDRVLVALLIFTGVRRGEALGLRWTDIDFERKLIHIQRSVGFMSNQPIVGPPKSKAGLRFIPLQPQLEAILKPFAQKDGYVLGGEEPLTQMNYKRGWQRICKTINMHGATAHVLRHTYITMAAAHVDVKTLQTIAGHADISTTMNRYAHGREDKIIAAVGMLDNMYV